MVAWNWHHTAPSMDPFLTDGLLSKSQFVRQCWSGIETWLGLHTCIDSLPCHDIALLMKNWISLFCVLNRFTFGAGRTDERYHHWHRHPKLCSQPGVPRGELLLFCYHRYSVSIERNRSFTCTCKRKWPILYNLILQYFTSNCISTVTV